MSPCPRNLFYSLSVDSVIISYSPPKASSHPCFLSLTNRKQYWYYYLGSTLSRPQQSNPKWQSSIRSRSGPVDTCRLGFRNFIRAIDHPSIDNLNSVFLHHDPYRLMNPRFITLHRGGLYTGMPVARCGGSRKG